MTIGGGGNQLDSDRAELIVELRRGTGALHAMAERSGIVADLLRGRASRLGYSLYLRNLLPAYQAMETAFESHRGVTRLGLLARREIYRSEALEADLGVLQGRDWRLTLPILPEAAQYVEAVAAARDGGALIGHAYVRYLGDLNGGRVLARVLAKSLDLESAALNFYGFPLIDDLSTYQTAYRDVISMSADPDDHERIVGAAVGGFSLNIALSEAVQCAVAEETRPVVCVDNAEVPR